MTHKMILKVQLKTSDFFFAPPLPPVSLLHFLLERALQATVRRMGKKLGAHIFHIADRLFCCVSESQAGANSNDVGSSNSQVNPFSRPGGTILLPSIPPSGLSQHSHFVVVSLGFSRTAKQIITSLQ